MQLFYPKSSNLKLLACALLSACFLLLSSNRLTAQIRDSTVTSIFTDFKTYWQTSITGNNSVYPDTSHNLLAFTFRGKTYSTGVNNNVLNTKLGTGNYTKAVFKALPVKNIGGVVTSTGSTYIATASKNDGDSSGFGYKVPYPTIHIADVLTDGKNGLDLGTGVTNLPKGAQISFAIKNLSTKASTDSVPDLVFTQIADPSTSTTDADAIYFTDANGKLVGNKKLVYWTSVSKLGTYKLDLYKLSYEACNTATINGSYASTPTRDIRMVAFMLTEFGITNADSAAKVKNIQIDPCGTSDQAFIAYNTSILNIDVPVINTQPATQTFCSAAASSSVTFSVDANSSTTLSYQWKKNGAAISGATSSSYTVTGLTTADTANAYTVTVTNSVGAITSDPAYVKYVIATQPANQYVATGTTAIFTVKASAATAYQWYKNGSAITGATFASYSIPAATLALSGSSYYVAVTSAIGTCNSNTATLTVEDLPVITAQPQSRGICNTDTTTITFNVAATSTSALTYQWQKNSVAIPGATSSSYTATGLTISDTTNVYRVIVKNGVGSITSNSAGFRFIINTQPAPASAYLATGNTVTFTATASSAATAFQWKKDGNSISGATSLSYSMNSVNAGDAGSYILYVSYPGGICVSNAGVLTTSTILYSKPGGNLSNIATWGVLQDGSGSSPVDFTRAEHTFIVANRDTANTTADLTIAGTLDLANAKTSITPGTTLEAGRIIRSLTAGTLAGSSTSALTVHGNSHLYFDTENNTLQNLLINTSDTVTLHTQLNMTAGNGHGVVTVKAGSFNTGDFLTLKSDAFGTASIGNSAGTISGKVTVERFIPARRAWRLFSAPVAKNSAPTINAAWQEGAANSTDNPHPGFGTHITYGAESDGFDQNPQKSFSMYTYNTGFWYGVPATKTTSVTDYSAYLFFIRGDRSYDIKATTNITTPTATILRTTGIVNQGTQAAIPVSASGLTLIGNPYASPINFEKVYQHSTNIAHHLRIWDPTLGGAKGVGAYVLLYWDGNDYSAVPNVGNASVLKNIQANQGFFVESTGNAGSVTIMESDKDTTNTTVPFGRVMGRQTADVAKLEVNLKVFNEDSTTSITDGVVYMFNDAFNTSLDDNDIVKITNTNESLGIVNGSNLLTVDQRSVPENDASLHLSFKGAKTTSYQLELISGGDMGIVNMYLYDKYLNTLSPITKGDTSRFTIGINTSIPASKAIDRFTIIVKEATILPVTITKLKAYTNGQEVQVDWSTENESNIRYYEVEKSCNGNSFNSAKQVTAAGSTTYNFTDANPCSGNNYYRIKSVSMSGEVSYTKIVNVEIESGGKPSIAACPNPLTTSHFMLELKNLPAGKYNLTLTSNTGQVVYRNNITCSNTTTIQPVNLPKLLVKGVYQLQVEGNGNKEVIKLLCNY